MHAVLSHQFVIQIYYHSFKAFSTHSNMQTICIAFFRCTPFTRHHHHVRTKYVSRRIASPHKVLKLSWLIPSVQPARIHRVIYTLFQNTNRLLYDTGFIQAQRMNELNEQKINRSYFFSAFFFFVRCTQFAYNIMSIVTNLTIYYYDSSRTVAIAISAATAANLLCNRILLPINSFYSLNKKILSCLYAIVGFTGMRGVRPPYV